MSQQELHGLYGAVKQSELCWPSVMQCGLYGTVNKNGLFVVVFLFGGGRNIQVCPLGEFSHAYQDVTGPGHSWIGFRAKVFD